MKTINERRLQKALDQLIKRGITKKGLKEIEPLALEVEKETEPNAKSKGAEQE